MFLQKRQPDFDFIDPLAPKKARISHLSSRGPATSSSFSSSDRREDEASKLSSLPSVTSGPPTHLPISSHPPALSHQQPSPGSNSNSPSTPEGCGTQDLPIDQSSSCRDPVPSRFSSSRTLQDNFQHPVTVPRPASSPSPPPRTSLTVTSAVTSPTLSSSTNKKFKKKSKKHKDKDRQREKGTERGSSPAKVAEQAKESRKAKKRRSAKQENNEAINKNPLEDQGAFFFLLIIYSFQPNVSTLK